MNCKNLCPTKCDIHVPYVARIPWNSASTTFSTVSCSEAVVFSSHTSRRLLFASKLLAPTESNVHQVLCLLVKSENFWIDVTRNSTQTDGQQERGRREKVKTCRQRQAVGKTSRWIQCKQNGAHEKLSTVNGPDCSTKRTRTGEPHLFWQTAWVRNQCSMQTKQESETRVSFCAEQQSYREIIWALPGMRVLELLGSQHELWHERELPFS